MDEVLREALVLEKPDEFFRKPQPEAAKTATVTGSRSRRARSSPRSSQTRPRRHRAPTEVAVPSSFRGHGSH